MKNDLPWIFITTILALLLLGAIHAEPAVYFRPSIADWIIAIGAVASVAVAARAANYLKATLDEAQESNKKLTDQLLSNRARLYCVNLEPTGGSANYNGFRYTGLTATIKNIGESAALNVRSSIIAYEKQPEKININEFFQKLDSPTSKVLAHGAEDSVHADFHFPTNPPPSDDPEKSTFFAPVWIIVISFYKDIHNQCFLSLRGFQIDFSPGKNTVPTIEISDSYPYSEEYDITDNFWF